MEERDSNIDGMELNASAGDEINVFDSSISPEEAPISRKRRMPPSRRACKKPRYQNNPSQALKDHKASTDRNNFVSEHDAELNDVSAKLWRAC